MGKKKNQQNIQISNSSDIRIGDLSINEGQEREAAGREVEKDWSIPAGEARKAGQEIAKGELGKALDLLHGALKPGQRQAEKQLILLQQRLATLEGDYRKGIISNEAYTLARNRLANDLLVLI